MCMDNTSAMDHEKDLAKIKASVHALLSSSSTPHFWQKVHSSPITEVFYYTEKPHVYLKVFAKPSIKDQLKYLYKGSRCQRTLKESRRLIDSGFDTPSIIFSGKQDSNEWFVSSAVNGIGFGTYLANFCRHPQPGKEAHWKHNLHYALGKITGELHSANIIHGDLRPENILVDLDSSTPRLHLIDVERNRYYRLSAPKSERVKNLVQINMLFQEDLNLAGRVRVIKAYLKHSKPLDKAGERELIRTVLEITEERLAKRNGKRFLFIPQPEEKIANHPIAKR